MNNPITAEIEPPGAYTILKSTCIKVVGGQSYPICGHLYAKDGLDVTSLIKLINAFDPSKPACDQATVEEFINLVQALLPSTSKQGRCKYLIDKLQNKNESPATMVGSI